MTHSSISCSDSAWNTCCCCSASGYYNQRHWKETDELPLGMGAKLNVILKKYLCCVRISGKNFHPPFLFGKYDYKHRGSSTA